MERSVEFGTRTAGEIMTPRVRTDERWRRTTGPAAVIELARQSGHSRFPVLDGEDNVVGTVHVKHAVALPVPERATTRVKHIMVKPIVVPDSIRLDPLLAHAARATASRWRSSSTSTAATPASSRSRTSSRRSSATSPTSTTGSAPGRRQRRDGSWSLSGLLRPDEVEDLTGIELPEHEDYDTIAGLVLRVLGRVPSSGDVAEVPVPDRSDPRTPRSGWPC